MFAAVITLLLLPSAPEEILAEGLLPGGLSRWAGVRFLMVSQMGASQLTLSIRQHTHSGWSSLPDGVTDGSPLPMSISPSIRASVCFSVLGRLIFDTKMKRKKKGNGRGDSVTVVKSVSKP